MTEDDTYLSMIALRQAKKVKNTCSGASNLSLCMSYVVKRDTRAYSRLPLPLLKERIIELTNRDALVSGILLSHLRDVVQVTLKIEAYLESIENEITPDELERLEQQIINAALCPAEFHYKKKRKRRHSTKS